MYDVAPSGRIPRKTVKRQSPSGKGLGGGTRFPAGYDSFEPDPELAGGFLGVDELDLDEPASPPVFFLGALAPPFPPGSPTPRYTVVCFLGSFW